MVPSFRLTVFLQHLYQFNFALCIVKFMRCLKLGPDDPCRPHPALMNALYLLACHYSTDPSVKRHEHTFLTRAQRHLDDSLGHVDRLIDFVLATTLLARHSYIKGAFAKGLFFSQCEPSLVFITRYLLAPL